VQVPHVDGGNQVPGAAIRWSFANQNFRKSKGGYNEALVVNGAFVNQSGAGVMNASSFVRTPDYNLANSPVFFSNLRNPGLFTTDASILKRFYIGEKSRYIEARLEAENILNHANFGSIINDPDSPVFGGINGKTGQRVMQVGIRFFF
jgi:hypothetical protein